MEAARRARSGGAAIVALCSVQFIDVVGVTVVVTALPRMLATLHAAPSAGSLVSGASARRSSPGSRPRSLPRPAL